MRYTGSLLLTLIVCVAGCTPPPEFRQNAVEVKKLELQALGEEEQFAAGQLEDILF